MNLRSVLIAIVFGAVSSLALAVDAQSQFRSDGASDNEQITGSHAEKARIDSFAGETGLDNVADVFEPEHEIEFSIYVPENYSSGTPAGLMIYVSPIESGEIPAAWKTLFDRRGLIWIGVNQSGNRMPQQRRILEAMASLSFAARNYEIDPQRIYTSGMSGGAQISNIAAALYPDAIRGGIFLSGVFPWSEKEPHPWLQDKPDNFHLIVANRYVFISGTEDFKLAAVASVYRAYRKSGVDDSKLFVIQDMGHDLPDVEYFEKAIEFLDGDLTGASSN